MLADRTANLRCPVDPNKVKYMKTSYTNCGVRNTLTKTPERVVTINQGATEFMLAMGLEDKMVGTSYIDDVIWPRYKEAYDKIPILSKKCGPSPLRTPATQLVKSRPRLRICASTRVQESDR
eukprot:scaffold1531_cov59-Phaeocystis_antarctica.AAC.3